MRSTRSMVISMRLPAESGKRLKRMANRHGWTPSDASARLVEEGLRRPHRAMRFSLGRRIPSRKKSAPHKNSSAFAAINPSNVAP